MAKYTIKRILLLIPTLFIVCVIVFALLRLVPGSALDQIVYKYSTAGIEIDKEAVAAQLGMDKPAVVQFFSWMGDLLRGDMGESLFQAESVWAIIKRQLPVSLELGVLTLILTNLISIPLGLFCAARQDSISDQAIRTVSVILMSLPVFWIGTLVLIYPAKWFGYAPATMYVPFFKAPLQNLSMFIIPSLLGAMTQAGAQIRMVRTMTLEVMRQDYIRTARAKGLPEWAVVWKHGFRTALLPVVTTILNHIPHIIGGSLVVERIFGWPGMGSLLFTSVSSRDYTVIMGLTVVIALTVLATGILMDLVYRLVDPGVGWGGEGR